MALKLISDEFLFLEYYPVNLLLQDPFLLISIPLTKVIVHPAFESVEVPPRRLSTSCLCLWNC